MKQLYCNIFHLIISNDISIAIFIKLKVYYIIA